MQADYKNRFWSSFDESFEPNHIMILRGLTVDRFESATIVNTFYSGDKESADFYLNTARALMEIENLDDDISIPSMGTGTFSAHSINLKSFLSKVGFETFYQSIDETQLSQYKEGESNLNADFSFLLGNFSRFFKNGSFRINDTKRLYILTAILEKFTHSNDHVKLHLSNAIDGSFIEVNNPQLIGRLTAQLR